MNAKSLFEKVWDAHVVAPESDERPAILYVDLHLIHEVTSPQAFDVLREKGLKVRRPDLCLATLDHSIPTVPIASLKDLEIVSEPAAAKQLIRMEENCAEFGIELRGFGSDERGIVHVIGPELGATQPGKTIVCGDSHTSTHGAFGALAFGIGTTEVGHALATQCLLQRRPRTLAINLEGTLRPGVTAKDIILRIIGAIGVGGGNGHAIEYRGSAIAGLSMEERMTICNMSIEAGARAGMIAPDDATYEYMAGRPLAPRGQDWDKALAHWRTLPGDADAQYDKSFHLNVSELTPMVTFGTNPGMVISIDDAVPEQNDPAFRKALSYMRLEAGKPLNGKAVDVVFIGSCTNGRLSDIEQAASVLEGRRVSENVRLLVVPGSERVKREAEAKGLHEIVRAAGGEWREPGCSMCIAMNGDRVTRGKLAVSTSNRNFEGRQGSGARTILASPVTAAAAAVTGVVTDPRRLLS
ncbi:3-isopropylmalate dehydratase large subunit [Candidatus Rariloculus sp.]|uniref:3-isopropylmalate dehydratase large subunit n=1 Tax=Candidatus Rariloculus sp. TaxID=3101265 RepID=UPI003D0C0B81